LVTFAVPHDLNPIFETALAEAMSVPLPASRGMLSIDDHDVIESVLQGKDGLVLGPGIGTEEATAQLVLRLYTESSRPQVVDADALNILAAHPEALRQPAGPRILTPHPGEMARLLGITIDAIQADRLAAAQRLNEMIGSDGQPVITVLKGAGTVVAANSGQWAINTSGNPGMGTGGMGDVLAGLIGGLVVQGQNPWQAACLGVYLHGLAADRLASIQPYGYTATEVAHMVPQVIGTSNPSEKESLC
jgi:NAD(P)H-hydrate epimerase